MHHCGLTPNPTAFFCPPRCPAWGRTWGEFWGWVASLTDWQWVQTLLKGRLAMPRGWCRPSMPASASSRLWPATTAGPGIGGDTSWSCCLWREKKSLGSASLFTTAVAQRLVGFIQVWRRSRCGGEAVKRCLVFPPCHAQLLDPVLAACTRLCQNSNRCTFIPCQAAQFGQWYVGTSLTLS